VVDKFHWGHLCGFCRLSCVELGLVTGAVLVELVQLREISQKIILLDFGLIAFDAQPFRIFQVQLSVECSTQRVMVRSIERGRPPDAAVAATRWLKYEPLRLRFALCHGWWWQTADPDR
jgi:hypothetical protein